MTVRPTQCLQSQMQHKKESICTLICQCDVANAFHFTKMQPERGKIQPLYSLPTGSTQHGLVLLQAAILLHSIILTVAATEENKGSNQRGTHCGSHQTCPHIFSIYHFDMLRISQKKSKGQVNATLSKTLHKMHRVLVQGEDGRDNYNGNITTTPSSLSQPGIV